MRKQEPSGVLEVMGEAYRSSSLGSQGFPRVGQLVR
jgi:hypothetical protein